MISKSELLEHAKAFSLNPEIVEKDYILGWILAGIAHNQHINNSWVFKGGTCLKKCYFETYRFSEDLDFTILDSSQIDEKFLSAVLSDISSWVYERSGIEMPPDQISVEVLTKPRGILTSQCKMGYIGPLQRRNSIPKIKFDLSADEILVLEPVTGNIYHPYSDAIIPGMEVLCYSYEEVFAEKVRALYERIRPRDLYDVIHLYRNRELVADRRLLLSVLEDKCAFKGIETPTFHLLDNHPQKSELSAEWSNMLKHQIAVLPEVKQFWGELPFLFDWIEGKESPLGIPRVESEEGSIRWQQGRILSISRQTSSLDRIQFGAANRVCIRLTYSNKVRTVEPYSFRKTKKGDILFYGYEREAALIKSYRVDRIQSVDVTTVGYSPRYAVEISSIGATSIPNARRRTFRKT